MSQTADSSASQSTSDAEKALEATLFRLTNGLPRRELNLIVNEADECEAALLHDIQVLEQALDKPSAAADEILQSASTPMDRYWTVSSLLGRLCDEWALPGIAASDVSLTPANPSPQTQGLLDLTTPPSPQQDDPTIKKKRQVYEKYTKKHETNTTLLAVWKKISLHRSSAVFKRPVKPEEAPGYTERIVFPMDLSMIRKLIVARQIVSFADLHQYIALISHNCVKYNGRESDYGRVAREFEAAANEFVRQAVEQALLTPEQTAPSALTTTDGADTPTLQNQAVPSVKVAAKSAKGSNKAGKGSKTESKPS